LHHDCPAVFQNFYAGRPALTIGSIAWSCPTKFRTFPVHEIRHLRLFVHGSSHAVPDKFPDDAEPVAFDIILNRPRNVRDLISGSACAMPS
jgi:hypothetical protein